MIVIESITPVLTFPFQHTHKLTNTKKHGPLNNVRTIVEMVDSFGPL